MGRDSFPGLTPQPQNLAPKCVFEKSIRPATNKVAGNSGITIILCHSLWRIVITSRLDWDRVKIEDHDAGDQSLPRLLAPFHARGYNLIQYNLPCQRSWCLILTQTLGLLANLVIHVPG